MQVLDTTPTAVAPTLLPWAMVFLFTILSGIGDAFGFIYASRVWEQDRFVWSMAIKSALAFQAGALMMWLGLRYLMQLGVIAAETQTLLWFTVTILGVALLSGKFLLWERFDQAIGILVLSGVVLLMVRTNA